MAHVRYMRQMGKCLEQGAKRLNIVVECASMAAAVHTLAATVLSGHSAGYVYGAGYGYAPGYGYALVVDGAVVLFCGVAGTAG
jgi:hypothetical protein